MSVSRQVRRAAERAARKGHFEAIDDLVVPDPIEIPEEAIEAFETSHPQRYPRHGVDNDLSPAKGQVYGGECNITRCTRTGAVFWNMGTYGLYCPSCAKEINWQRHKPPLCVRVEAKPALEDMEQFKRDNRYYEAV